MNPTDSHARTFPGLYDNPTNGKCEHCGITGDCVICGHVDDSLAPVIAEIYRQTVIDS